MKHQVDHALEYGSGFYLGCHFTPEELTVVRGLVRAQWLDTLKQTSPKNWQYFEKEGIEKYHELSHLIDHSTLWPKQARILPQAAIDVIRQTSLFEQLESIYGAFTISDEENVGREEIYWRLVRPQQASDVGPLHADAWFWSLGHGNTPSGVKRVKVWVALFCEPGKNGLRLVPESHLKDWKYHGEYRDGFSKPQIDEKEENLNIQLAHTEPGNAVIFHDKLLHGGAVNQGNYTRVSMEFTMFVNL